MSIRKSLRVVATLLRIFSKIPEAASASATLKIITATDKKAIKEMDGKVINKKKLTVQVKKPKSR